MDEAKRTDIGTESPDAASSRLAALAAALVESDEIILKATTEAEVYVGLCQVIVRHLGLPLAWVGLTEPGIQGLRVQGAAGTLAGYLDESGFASNGVTPVGGIISRALRTGQAQAIVDLASEPEDLPARAAARKHGIRSSASFPIRIGHMVVGTLQCSSDLPGYFDPQAMASLGRLAATASTMLVVLDHEHRRREMEQHLTSSENRRRGLFELAPVAILVLQTDRIETNGSFLEMFRLKDQAALEEAGLLSLVDPRDVDAVEAMRSSVSRVGERARILQATGRRADGSSFPMLVERVQLELDGDPSVVVFVTDLTPLETAEERSRQSRAHLDAVVGSAPLALLSLDLDGIVRSWNPAAEAIFGRTPAEAIGRPAPGGQPQIDGIRRLAHGEVEQLRGELIRHVRRDGQAMDLRISTAPLAGRDGESLRLLVAAEDVTDINRVEAERARLSTAIDQSSELIVITDAAAAIQYVNPAFERLTGYSRAEVIGRNPRLLQSGIQNPAFYAAMWGILTRGETWRGTFMNRTKNGRLFEEDAAISPVFDSTGQLVNYVAVKRDVTRERQSEQALRQSEERFRRVFDFANDSIFIRDLDGRLLEANRVACERMGYSRDELLTMSVADIDTPEFTPLLAARTEDILKNGSASFESGQLRRDGKVTPVEVNATLTELGGRDVILSVVRDVTERKRAEAALRQSEARYRAIVEHMPVAIGVSRLGLTVEVNERYRRMFGLRPNEEIAGRSLLDQIAPECRADVGAFIRRRDEDGFRTRRVRDAGPEGRRDQVPAPCGRRPYRPVRRTGHTGPPDRPQRPTPGRTGEGRVAGTASSRGRQHDRSHLVSGSQGLRPPGLQQRLPRLLPK